MINKNGQIEKMCIQTKWKKKIKRNVCFGPRNAAECGNFFYEPHVTRCLDQLS
jgi:hypothetical protein